MVRSAAAELDDLPIRRRNHHTPAARPRISFGRAVGEDHNWLFAHAQSSTLMRAVVTRRAGHPACSADRMTYGAVPRSCAHECRCDGSRRQLLSDVHARPPRSAGIRQTVTPAPSLPKASALTSASPFSTNCIGKVAPAAAEWCGADHHRHHQLHPRRSRERIVSDRRAGCGRRARAGEPRRRDAAVRAVGRVPAVARVAGRLAAGRCRCSPHGQRLAAARSSSSASP